MILSLSGRDQRRYPHLFEQMYRQRHAIFVGRRGWRSLEATAGVERDCYDTPEACYLIATGPRGDMRASVRLLPTLGPHLLADRFGHLAPAGVPRGRDIREVSRFYVTGGGSPARRLKTIETLSAGLFASCREEGIATLTCTVDTFMLPIMRRHRWSFNPLGPAQPCPEGTIVAVEICVATSLADITAARPPADAASSSARFPPLVKVALPACPT